MLNTVLILATEEGADVALIGIGAFGFIIFILAIVGMSGGR